MSGVDYGHTVVNGVVQYLSPSGITTYDPSQDGGCYRKGYITYVMRIKEASTSSQVLGVQTHEEIDHYQKTGEMTLGRLAMSARHYIPDPSTLATSELQLQDTVHDAEGKFLGWPGPPVLAISGIRTVGHIDLYRPYGHPDAPYYSEYIDYAGETCRDADYTVEVADWKTSKDIAKWAKLGPQLIKTDQMALYAKYATVRHPDAKQVRISHVYMQTKGAAKAHKSTALINLEQIEKRWNEMGGVARTIIDVAKATNPNNVPPNRYACSAFRGCMHRGTPNCIMTQRESIDQIFGITKSDLIKGKQTMSLIDDIKKLEAQEAPVGVPEVPAPSATPDFLPQWETILIAGKGYPPLDPVAAQAYASAYGVQVASGVGLAGDGQLGTLRALSLEDVKTLADNLAPQAPPAPVATTGALPPNVPPASPVTPQAPVAATTPVAATVQIDTVSPQAPDVQHVTNDAAVTKALACREKKSFSTMRKDDIAAAFCAMSDAYDAKTTPSGDYDKTGLAAGGTATTNTQSGYTLAIDTLPSQPSDRLDDYVRKVCALLEEQTGCKDIRCSDHDQLTFGKWKGALAACVRAVPLEDGCYTIWTTDEINTIVANTLCEGASAVFRGTKQ